MEPRDPSAPTPRTGGQALATVACFFLSGAPALVDQVVWGRAFSRVFGSSTHAVATVLAGFMVGLALGSFLAGRLAGRIRRPYRVYALLEVGIAAYAAVSMPLIDAAASAADAVLAAPGVPLGARTAGLFLTSFLLLLPPTMLMGATLPTLASLVPRGVGLSLPLLYGVNTLGAAAGAVVGGFVMLPALGFQRTLLASAAVNLLVALLAALLSARGEPPTVDVLEPGSALPAVARASLLFFLATSGAATMAYEIVLTRVTALLFGSSTYSFAVVLAAFLTGIGIGGVLDHGRRAPPGLASARRLPLLAGVGSVAVLVTSLCIGWLPAVSFELHRSLAGRFGIMQASLFGTLALLALPPALVLGMTFPAALRGLVSGTGWGRAVGAGTAVNTVGAGVGAVGAGFFLLPRVGLEPLLEGTAVAMGVVALAVAVAVRAGTARIGLLAGLLAILAASAAAGPRWPRKELAFGIFRTFKLATSYEDLRSIVSSRKILFDKDGPSASVAVLRSEGGTLSLRVNGKADASTDPIDIHTQILSSLLPAFVHGAPRSFLVIGLGSAATAHAALDYPTTETVDVAEIEPAVAEAAALHFGSLNHGVLRDPRMRLHVEDGRRFVRRARTRYDVIVSEPSNPWIAGVADLYTVEHMRRVDAALAPDGVFVQWIQGYSLSRRFILATMATVADVFPEVSLWFTNGSDFLVVASRQPISLHVAAAREAAAGSAHLREELERVDVLGPRGLVSRYLLGTAEIRKLTADAPVMHDDHPILEYQAPRELHRAETLGDNFAFFVSAAVPCPLRDADAPPETEAEEWRQAALSASRSDRPDLAKALERLATSGAVSP